jgi:hypothetical protein
MYLPQAVPNSDDALSSVDIASRNMNANLIDFVPEFQVDLESGYAEMVDRWYAQGGQEVFAEAQGLYDGSR